MRLLPTSAFALLLLAVGAPLPLTSGRAQDRGRNPAPAPGLVGGTRPSAERVTRVGRLRIEVRSPDGDPVSNAEVLAFLDAHLSGAPGLDRTRLLDPPTRLSTDREGEVEFGTAGRPIALLVIAEDRSCALLEHVAPTGQVLVHLSRPARLLVDRPGDSIWTLQSEDARIPILTDTEASEGSLTVPAGRYWLELRRDGGREIHRVAVEAGETRTLPPAATTRSPGPSEATPKAPPGWSLLGRGDPRLRPMRRRDAGTPDAGARFVVQPSRELDGPPDDRISVVDLTRSEEIASALAPTPERRVAFGFDPVLGVSEIVLQWVRQTDVGQVITHSTLNAARASVELPEGSSVLFTAPGMADHYLELPSGPGDPIQVRQRAETPLTLLVETGDDPQSSTLTAFTRLDTPELFYRVTVADARGRLVFRGLSPVPERTLVLRRGDGFPRRFEVLGNPAVVSLRWEPGDGLVGEVRLPGGEPAVDVAVELRSPELGSRVDPIYAITDEAGGFDFVDLPSRVYLLSTATEIDGSKFIAQLRAEPNRPADGGPTGEPWILELRPEDPPPPGRSR